ncbi:MAG: MFS transporter [Mycoplasmatales bacterium]
MTKKKMLILCMIIIFTMMGYGTVIPLNNYFVNNLDFSSLQVGLLISLYALGQLISALIISGFVDQIGNKKSIIASFILYILFFNLTFLLTNKSLILSSRLISGICAGTITLAIENYIGMNVIQTLKVKYFTYSSLAIGIGMVIGPLLGLILLISKVILLIITVISIAMIYLLIKLLSTDEPTNNQQNMFQEIKTTFLLALKVKLNIYILLIFLIFGIITSALESKIVVFVLDNYQLKNLNLILVLWGILIIIIYALILHHQVERKLKTLNYGLIMILLTALALIIIFLSQNKINVLVIGFILLIIALSSLISTLTSLITTHTKAGLLLGLKNTFLFIGMIIGPIITAIIYDINSHILFLILGIIMLVMFIYGQFYLKK